MLHVGRAGRCAMQSLPWFWLFYFWHLVLACHALVLCFVHDVM
jgi:hypothetical protein